MTKPINSVEDLAAVMVNSKPGEVIEAPVDVIRDFYAGAGTPEQDFPVPPVDPTFDAQLRMSALQLATPRFESSEDAVVAAQQYYDFLTGQSQSSE